MTEQFTNNATTTLTTSALSSDTTITVASVSLFPVSAQYRIMIDSEIMLVTNIVGTTLTVTRGAEGTVAAAHSNGATVEHILTAGAIAQLKSDTIASTVQTGAYSSLPAAGTPGRIFLPNNGMALFEDNGTTWNSFGPVLPLVAPPTVTIGTNFSFYQQNGVSIVNGPGTLVATVPFSATQGLCGIVQTGSGSNTMFVESASSFICSGVTGATSNNIPMGGVLMVESSTGKYCGILAGIDGGISSTSSTPVVDFSYGQNTTRTAFTRSFIAYSQGTPIFTRIRLTNGAAGNVVGEISIDRQNWISMGSVATSTAFTSVPNQVGFSVYPWQMASSGIVTTVSFFHYNQG